MCQINLRLVMRNAVLGSVRQALGNFLQADLPVLISLARGISKRNNAFVQWQLVSVRFG
jgi:hypothetical protein